MARIPNDQPLTPSLLDRLLDDHPGSTQEVPAARGQTLRGLKESIRRDLENLLNTRWSPTTWPEHLEDLELSLVNYGIPDITGGAFGFSQTREEFPRIVETVIRHFEPRFKSVKVVMLENIEPLDRTLRFRIEAQVHAEPAPEPLAFDSTLQPVTGNVEIRGTS